MIHGVTEANMTWTIEGNFTNNQMICKVEINAEKNIMVCRTSIQSSLSHPDQSYTPTIINITGQMVNTKLYTVFVLKKMFR